MRMTDMKENNLQYVTNQAGEKTAVILPISEFEELLEDLRDLAAVAERRTEPTVSHDEVLAELNRDDAI
jgi:hypothetical protein